MPPLTTALPTWVGAPLETARDAVPLAHGLGTQRDLPISLELAVAGSVAALVVSFTVLGLAWRTPRYAADDGGRAVPWLSRVVLGRGWRVGARVLGLLLFLYTAFVAVFGPDLLTNPFFGIFYVWWWVGIVPASLLLGPVWRAISPLRTLHGLLARVTGSDPHRGVRDYPAWLGYWPAALGLYAFVWMELVYPDLNELGPVRLWCAVYVAVLLVGGAVFGDTFFEHADPFEVYSSLLAKLSVWHVRDGELLVRSPLANLDTVAPVPGLVAVVAVLFGSTGYDSYRESSAWVQLVQGWHVSGYLIGNVALLLTCVLVGVLLAVACRLTPAPGVPARELPGRFAHSIVPIIAGYVVAHYATYLWVVGQKTVIQASDPFSTGANWFGTANLQISYWLPDHPGLVANLKVLAVVVGHVLGVVAAHERAVGLVRRRHQLTGQLPLLVVMVVFTAGGLTLLFSA